MLIAILRQEIAGFGNSHAAITPTEPEHPLLLVIDRDRSTAGHYVFEGRNLTTLSNDELAYVRNQRISFIFQQFNLLPRSTALENVMLPMIYANVPQVKRHQHAIAALTRVGLADRFIIKKQGKPFI